MVRETSHGRWVQGEGYSFSVSELLNPPTDAQVFGANA